MGDPRWFGGDVTEGFSVGAQVNVRAPMLDASSDCWFCDDSEDPNPPLPVGGYVVQVRLWWQGVACLRFFAIQTFFERSICHMLSQGFVCNGYCQDLDDETVPPHTRSLAPFAQKAFSVLPPQ